jgi:hypothetical protein
MSIHENETFWPMWRTFRIGLLVKCSILVFTHFWKRQIQQYITRTSNTFTVYVYVISTFSSVSIESVKSSEYSCMMYFQFPGPGLGFRVYTAKNAQVVPSWYRQAWTMLCGQLWTSCEPCCSKLLQLNNAVTTCWQYCS